MGSELTSFVGMMKFLPPALILVGLVLILVFGVHRALLSSGLLQPLTKQDSSLIVRLVLTYGVWIGLLVVLLGFIGFFLKL